ncbi:MAG: 50S ribosomal protein L6 [Holosporales bacterium]|jgi:large subunit ribosomal protein L6
MSRLGVKPIALPDGLTAQVSGNTVAFNSKLGKVEHTVHSLVTIKLDGKSLVLAPTEKTTLARTQWGTHHSLLRGIVQGLSKGYTVPLEITGVGFRAAVQGKELVLQLGFSHEVRYPIPAGITIKCDKPTSISITGADKQLVGQVAATIRGMKPVEPYKGKGIRFEGQKITLKEGKKK